MKALLVLIIVLYGISTHALGVPYRSLSLEAFDQGEARVDPSGFMKIARLEDGLDFTPEEVLSSALDRDVIPSLQWQDNRQQDLDSGPRAWLFLGLRNLSQKDLDLVLYNAFTYPFEVDFYVFDEQGRRLRHVSAGNHSHFWLRDFKVNKAALSLAIARGQSLYVLMKQTAPWTFDSRYMIDSKERFRWTERGFLTLFAVSAGIFIALLLYNLTFFFSTRDKVYLSCAVYVFNLCLLFSWLSGVFSLAWMHFPASLIYFPYSFPFFLNAAICLLVIHFLHLQTLDIKLYRAFLAISLLSLGGVPLAILRVEWSLYLEIPLLLAVAGLSLFCVLRQAIRKEAFAVIFLLSCLPPILTSFVFFLLREWYRYDAALDPMIISFVVHVLMLSLGLSHRIIELRRRYMRSLRDANARLESRVNERTRELFEANRLLNEEIAQRVAAQKSLEARQALMFHHARMRGLGELAGGLAHEVNNPLMIISGYSEMIVKLSRKSEASLERIGEIAQRIIQTSRRIAFAVQALRSYSQQRVQDEIEPLSVPHLVKQALALCQSRIQNTGVDLRLHLEELDIYGDASQILQALLAIIMNAIDAMSEEKQRTLTILAYASPEASSPKVLLEISDSGRGIKPELREKIFEAFFSTKEAEGAGLGLSIARSIIEKARGQLYLATDRTTTTFIIELPQALSSETSSG